MANTPSTHRYKLAQSHGRVDVAESRKGQALASGCEGGKVSQWVGRRQIVCHMAGPAPNAHPSPVHLDG